MSYKLHCEKVPVILRTRKKAKISNMEEIRKVRLAKIANLKNGNKPKNKAQVLLKSFYNVPVL